MTALVAPVPTAVNLRAQAISAIRSEVQLAVACDPCPCIVFEGGSGKIKIHHLTYCLDLELLTFRHDQYSDSFWPEFDFAMRIVELMARRDFQILDDMDQQGNKIKTFQFPNPNQPFCPKWIIRPAKIEHVLEDLFQKVEEAMNRTSGFRPHDLFKNQGLMAAS